MPRDPSSKIWSDWIYHVQCHVLQSEARSMLAGAAAAKEKAETHRP
jgi:hypothetical protein